MNGSTRDHNGFTVIELLVIITILVILMALLFPAFTRYRKSARTVQGLENLSQIVKGLTSYAVDHNNTFPIGYHDKGNPFDDPLPSPWNRIERTGWSILLNNYLSHTPDDMTSNEWGLDGIKLLPIFQDPNASFPNQGYLHYSAHPVLFPDTQNIFDSPNWQQCKLSRIKRPSEIILVMDGTQRPTASDQKFASSEIASNIDNSSLNPNTGIIFFDPAQTDLNTPINPGANQDTGSTADIRWRQGADSDNPTTWKANFVFPDGHAATLFAPDIKKRHVRIDK